MGKMSVQLSTKNDEECMHVWIKNGTESKLSLSVAAQRWRVLIQALGSGTWEVHVAEKQGKGFEGGKSRGLCQGTFG